jgi:hypothetical protein
VEEEEQGYLPWLAPLGVTLAAIAGIVGSIKTIREGCWPQQEPTPETVPLASPTAASASSSHSRRYVDDGGEESGMEDTPSNSSAWNSLGIQGGGTVQGTIYNKKDCFMKALQLNPNNANAWINIGFEGGGTVQGKIYNKKDCFMKTLQLDPNNAYAWKSLGVEGGGTVQGKSYSQQQCFEEFQRRS